MNKHLWIINQYTSTPKLGGGGNRSYLIANELIKKGCDVSLVTASYSHVPKRDYPVENHFHFEKEDQLNLVIVKNIVYDSGRSMKRILSMLIFWLKLYWLPIKKMKEPNYILVSSISLLPILNAFYWKRKFKNKPKIILEIRDIWPLTILELGNFSKYNPFVLFLSWVEKRGYKNSDYLTSVLPLANKHFEKVAGRKVKFKHIPNGIHLETITKEEALDSSTLDLIPKEGFIVGYTGALGVANAMEYFVELASSFSEIEDVHFVIIGDGYETENLKKQAEGLKNIFFVPRINKQQVQSALRLFDVLYISWRDRKLYHFGISANKIFDYMYAAKPIVMSGKIEENEIDLANCGFVTDFDDTPKMKDYILHLKNMSVEERNELGKRGKQFVIDHRSYENLSDKYIEVFSEID